MAKLKIEVSEDQLRKLKEDSNSPIKIVILQRGWVFIGRFQKIGQDCVLENASCIRTWGTTRGIGELVSGPTGSTKLDAAGTVRFHELTIVATIDCEESGWKSKI